MQFFSYSTKLYDYVMSFEQNCFCNLVFVQQGQDGVCTYKIESFCRVKCDIKRSLTTSTYTNSRPYMIYSIHLWSVGGINTCLTFLTFPSFPEYSRTDVFNHIEPALFLSEAHSGRILFASSFLLSGPSTSAWVFL